MSLPEGYWIRPFEPEDAPALRAITQSSIRRLGLRHYTHEQVEAWAARHSSSQRFIERAEGDAVIFVAMAGPVVPVAYTLIQLDNTVHAHLDMLYCHRQHTRQGIAEALLAKAENYARSEKSQRIYTEASELARPVFERAGYTVTHRRDFEIDGVAIHNYAMEKSLS